MIDNEENEAKKREELEDNKKDDGGIQMLKVILAILLLNVILVTRAPAIKSPEDENEGEENEGEENEGEETEEKENEGEKEEEVLAYDPAHPGKSFFVYCLVSNWNSTYIGATVDIHRRLRQHNKEISGGAVRTGRAVARGETWRIHRYIANIPTWKTCLSCEWKLKQLSRKVKHKNPVERHKIALAQLLSLPRATSKAIPFAKWPLPPQVHIMD
jgi:structure-specific endonuclease subunit SLX1